MHLKFFPVDVLVYFKLFVKLLNPRSHVEAKFVDIVVAVSDNLRQNVFSHVDDLLLSWFINVLNVLLVWIYNV